MPRRAQTERRINGIAVMLAPLVMARKEREAQEKKRAKAKRDAKAKREKRRQARVNAWSLNTDETDSPKSNDYWLKGSDNV